MAVPYHLVLGLALGILGSNAIETEIYLSFSSYGETDVPYGTIFVALEGYHSWAVYCTLPENNYWAISSVACRQMGFGPPALTYLNYDWDLVERTYQGHELAVTCKGTEYSLSQCDHNLRTTYCVDRSLTIVLRCLEEKRPGGHNHQLRIVEEISQSFNGTVLISYRHLWSPICGNPRHQNISSVVCRYFNFTNGTLSVPSQTRVYQLPLLDLTDCDAEDDIEDCVEYLISPTCNEGFLSVACFNGTSPDVPYSMPVYGTALLISLFVACFVGVFCCSLYIRSTKRRGAFRTTTAPDRAPQATANVTTTAVTTTAEGAVVVVHHVQPAVQVAPSDQLPPNAHPTTVSAGTVTIVNQSSSQQQPQQVTQQTFAKLPGSPNPSSNATGVSSYPPPPPPPLAPPPPPPPPPLPAPSFVHAPPLSLPPRPAPPLPPVHPLTHVPSPARHPLQTPSSYPASVSVHDPSRASHPLPTPLPPSASSSPSPHLPTNTHHSALPKLPAPPPPPAMPEKTLPIMVHPSQPNPFPPEPPPQHPDYPVAPELYPPATSSLAYNNMAQFPGNPPLEHQPEAHPYPPYPVIGPSYQPPVIGLEGLAPTASVHPLSPAIPPPEYSRVPTAPMAHALLPPPSIKVSMYDIHDPPPKYSLEPPAESQHLSSQKVKKPARSPAVERRRIGLESGYTEPSPEATTVEKQLLQTVRCEDTSYGESNAEASNAGVPQANHGRPATNPRRLPTVEEKEPPGPGVPLLVGEYSAEGISPVEAQDQIAVANIGYRPSLSAEGYTGPAGEQLRLIQSRPEQLTSLRTGEQRLPESEIPLLVEKSI